MACRRKWEWPRREALEIKASPLICAFWRKTGMDLTVASVKLCWEPTLRTLYHQRDNGPTTHIISYLDELAVHVPNLDAWDQMVLPTAVAILHALTEAELYGYCRDQAVDLGLVMLAAQFWVMEEGGAYLCTVRALVFEGSILAYNPAMNEAEWVPVHSLANDLSWTEERPTVALVNYVPCIPAEAAWITRLRASRIVSCPGNDSSISAEEEEAWHSDTQSTNPPTDTDPEAGDETEDGTGGQTDPEDAAERNRWWQPWNWEAIMEEAEGLAYDDLWSDSDTTVMGVNGLQGPALSLHDEAPELPRDCQWCTTLAGTYKHIYRGHDDVAHCPLYTLASWDCQERTKVLHQEGKLGSAWSGHKRASRSRKRSRSSSRHHSRTPALRDWSGHSCCPPPNMLPRCHCGEPLSPGTNTMCKLPLAINIPTYTWFSHLARGMARASLDDEEAREDDFQTPHTPVCRVVRQYGGSRGELATEQMEASRGSPAWWSFVQMDISKEEPETLEHIDPHWRAMHWLQVAVQGIADKEVPWYELVAPLTLGAEGMALSLAKHLVMVWLWNIKVHREDNCPPALSILNIGQFITDEEIAGGMGQPHWFMAYSCALQ